MNRSRHWRLYLIGAGFGTFLALLLSSRTRWVAVTQAMKLITGPEVGIARLAGDNSYAPKSSFYDFYPTNEQMNAEAAKHPNDLAMRWQAMLNSPLLSQASYPMSGNAEVRQAYSDLLKDFPGRLEAYAVIIRALSPLADRVLSIKANANLAPATAGKAGQSDLVVDEDGLRMMLETATAGEALDPDNSFFPTMAAMASFAMGNEAQGLAELHKAANAKQWADYLDIEFDGRWRLMVACGVPNTATTMMSASERTLLPHLTSIHSGSIYVAMKAAQWEKQGKGAEGLRLRTDLMRLAVTMRDGSTSQPAVQVACKAFEMATMSNPTELSNSGAISSYEGNVGGGVFSGLQPRTNSFVNRAKANHYDKLANWVALQSQSSEVKLAAAKYNGTEYSQVGSRQQAMLVTSGAQLDGLHLLSNVFWLLLVGGIAAGVASLQRRREPSKGSLSVWARCGYAAAYLGCVGISIMLINTQRFNDMYFVPLALGVWSLLITGLAFGWKGVVTTICLTVVPIVISFMTPMAAGVPVVSALISLFVRKRPLENRPERFAYGALPVAFAVSALCLGCAIFSYDGLMPRIDYTVSAFGQGSPVMLSQVSSVLAAGVAWPILLLLWMAMRSVVSPDARMRPVAEGIARNAPALAGLALVIYGFVAIQTVRVEARTAQSLLPYALNRVEAGTVGWMKAPPFPEEELR